MPCSCKPRFRVDVREYTIDLGNEFDDDLDDETNFTACACQAIRALEGNPLPSVWPVNPSRMTGREWLSTELHQQTDGTYIYQTIHVCRLDRNITGTLLAKLWKLAGIPNA